MRYVGDGFKRAKNQQSSRLIFLYEIRYDEENNQYLRWTSYGKPVSFEGYVYTPYVIQHDKIEDRNDGSPIIVAMNIGNIDRTIQAIIDNYGLNEKRVRIITLTEEDMSSVDAYMEDTFSIIDMTCSRSIVTMRLGSMYDVTDARVPKRFYFRSYCRFLFRGEDCKYVGTAQECNKTLQRCKELLNVTRFGAFPSVPDQKLMV